MKVFWLQKLTTTESMFIKETTTNIPNKLGNEIWENNLLVRSGQSTWPGRQLGIVPKLQAYVVTLTMSCHIFTHLLLDILLNFLTFKIICSYKINGIVLCLLSSRGRHLQKYIQWDKDEITKILKPTWSCSLWWKGRLENAIEAWSNKLEAQILF